MLHNSNIKTFRTGCVLCKGKSLVILHGASRRRKKLLWMKMIIIFIQQWAMDNGQKGSVFYLFILAANCTWQQLYSLIRHSNVCLFSEEHLLQHQRQQLSQTWMLHFQVNHEGEKSRFPHIKKTQDAQRQAECWWQNEKCKFLFPLRGISRTLDFVDVFAGCFLTFISMCFLSIPLYNTCPCSIQLSL